MTPDTTPCPACVGMAEAAVDRASVPLQPGQPGGFWEGFRYAQKALQDLRNTLGPRCYICLPDDPTADEEGCLGCEGRYVCAMCGMPQQAVDSTTPPADERAGGVWGAEEAQAEVDAASAALDEATDRFRAALNALADSQPVMPARNEATR